MDTGYFPAEGRLILNPTSYSTGGTDLGLVSSSHIVTHGFDTEDLTEHATGSSVVDTRMLGRNVSYLIHVIDFSNDLMDILFNNMNDGADFDALNGYNIGDILPVGNTHQLLIRPITDTGTFDVNKPVCFIPRGVVTSPTNFVYDRRLPHTAGMAFSVKGLFDTVYSSPFLYGDAATLPTIV